MKNELRHDIPVLIYLIVFIGFGLGTVITSSIKPRRFDRRAKIALGVVTAALILLGIVVYLLQLPESHAGAIYVAIVGGGVIFILGIFARDRVARAMAWNAWPRSYALRYPIETRLLAVPAVIAALAVGVSIYELLK